MYSLLIIIHVLVCVILTIVILLQSSKGGGLAGVFGGGGGVGAVFGGRGAAPFLSKLTTVLAILFMVVSLFLGMITKGGPGGKSIVSEERAKGNVSSPADVLPTVPTEGLPGEIPTPTPAANNEQSSTGENK